MLEFMSMNKDKNNALYNDAEQKYRALLDTTSAAIVLVSTSWICIDFNDAWCRFLGYSRDELLGMSPRELTHPDDIEESDLKQQKSSLGFVVA